MAFSELGNYPYSLQLIDLSKINKKTFNPSDYFDSTSNIVIKTDKLSFVSAVRTHLIESTGGVKRITADLVDRTTGEIIEPTLEEFQKLNCVVCDKGDIIFHKYSCRVGRIGLIQNDGFAEHHFIRIKPEKIRNNYLLLALRSIPVLEQLPYRETSRPGLRKSDVESLSIPRLGDSIEQKLDFFLTEIYEVRKRIHILFNGLMNNFNNALRWTLPKEGAFLAGSALFTSQTLDPGYYVMRLIDANFKRSERLGDSVNIIYPPSLNAGEKSTALTLSDYRYEGILPEHIKGVDEIHPKNFAKPGDLILNRLQSGDDRPAKATVVVPGLEYLSDFGVMVEGMGKDAKVPIYDQLFILKQKEDSKLNPYYLNLFFNSDLYQAVFIHIMGGSTGRQRIRKTRLQDLKVPLMEDGQMESLSTASKIALETQSSTFRILTELSRLYEDVCKGETQAELIDSFIEEHSKDVSVATASVRKAERILPKIENLVYSV